MNIDQEFVEPIKLTLGSNADTVSVEADSVQVNTTDMQLNNIVDSHQITELPLIGRAFTNLEQILPGVQASSDRFGSFSVNGSQTQQSAYVINGADSNDLPLNTIAIQPNIDALAQFNLVTGPLNAEYDRNGGAIVNTAIKQGTNHFHGDVFEFYRDTFLNTRNYFQKLTPTSTYHQNIFGGTIGGPILKDKLFFFGAYQGIRQVVPESGGNVSTFTPAQVAGNFSNALTPLAANGGAPAISTNTIPGTISIPGCSAGVDTFQQCFTRLNGQLPTSAVNPIASTLIKQFVPGVTSGANTYAFNPTVQTKTDQAIGRMDYNLTSKDQFYGVYIYQKSAAPETLPFTGATVPGFGDVSTSWINQASVGYTRQLSSTLVNDFELHYTRFNYQAVEPQKVVLPSSVASTSARRIRQRPAFPLLDSLAMASTDITSRLWRSDSVPTDPQPRIDSVFQLNDSVSKSLGHHNLKFGYDGRKYVVDNPFSANNNGSFSFDANPGDGNPFTSGDVALDFLLGIPFTYNQGSGAPINASAFLNYLFAQDTWKATNSLTLSFGLGYQIDTPLHNGQFNNIGVTCYIPGQQSEGLPSAPKNLNYPGDPGCNNASGATTRYSDFGPRFGFAWAT